MGNGLLRMLNSGSNWNNSAYGAASFNGNNDRSNRNINIGFRSASPPRQIRCTYRVLRQCNGV